MQSGVINEDLEYLKAFVRLIVFVDVDEVLSGCLAVPEDAQADSPPDAAVDVLASGFLVAPEGEAASVPQGLGEG